MGLDYLELSPTADFHSHLRDGDLMQLILPTITQGGCDTVYVMVCILMLDCLLLGRFSPASFYLKLIPEAK